MGPPGLPSPHAACLALGPQRWLVAALVLAGCAGLMAFGVRTARRAGFPGSGAFVAFQAASAAWVVLAAIEHLSPAAECKAAWALNAWPAIMATPMLWSLFLWRYSQGHAAPLPPAARAALWGMPLGMWAAALTNASHGLLYLPGTGPIGPGAGAPLRYEHGPLFWWAAAVAYGCMAAAVGTVLRGLWEARGPVRRMHVALLALTLIPWVANGAYLLLGLRLFGVDPTPIAFLVAIALGSVAIRRRLIFELVPVARGALVDALPDPVLVVDAAGRVIDANAAARRLGGGGMPLGTPLSQWPRIGRALGAAGRAGAGDREVQAEGRLYEVTQVPLASHGSPLGTLVYLRDVTERYRTERRLARALAQRDRQIARAAALQARLETLAHCDELTGLHNRRALDECFERESARALRAGGTLAVALIDLDHFKRVNDTHGHAVGDEVLVEFGARLSRACRASDGVFRLGGEEFAMVLPDCSLEDACARIERLIGGIAAQPFATSRGALTLTVSAGVTLWAGAGHSLKQTLHAADLALYAAKAAGRNRVVPAAPAAGLRAA